MLKNVCAFTVMIDAITSLSSPPFRPNPPGNERDKIPEEINILMKRCWAEQPHERPGFDEISKVLRHFNKGK
jgi:hypothetical protein